MEKLPFALDQSLIDNPPKIFGEVKYSVEGTVDPKITKLLENGGAKLLNYMGISSTHMITGDGADEVKIAEAVEVFEKPVVNQKWVAFCAKAGKLLPTDGFDGHSKRLFSGIRVCSSRIKANDLKSLWGNVTFYGGHFQDSLTSTTTHLITNEMGSKKFEKASEKSVKIVSCDWITDCIKANAIVDEAKYHPRLLQDPASSKSSKVPGIQGPTETAKQPTKTGPAQTKLGAKLQTPPVRPPQIVQVHLAGSSPSGPRGRGVAVRQQILVQKQAAGAPNVRAHRPLMVNSPQAKTKAVPPLLPTTQPPPPPVVTAPPQQQPAVKAPQQSPQIQPPPPQPTQTQQQSVSLPLPQQNTPTSAAGQQQLPQRPPQGPQQAPVPGQQAPQPPPASGQQTTQPPQQQPQISQSQLTMPSQQISMQSQPQLPAQSPQQQQPAQTQQQILNQPQQQVHQQQQIHTQPQQQVHNQPQQQIHNQGPPLSMQPLQPGQQQLQSMQTQQQIPMQPQQQPPTNQLQMALQQSHIQQQSPNQNQLQGQQPGQMNTQQLQMGQIQQQIPMSVQNSQIQSPGSVQQMQQQQIQISLGSQQHPQVPSSQPQQQHTIQLQQLQSQQQMNSLQQQLHHSNQLHQQLHMQQQNQQLQQQNQQMQQQQSQQMQQQNQQIQQQTQQMQQQSQQMQQQNQQMQQQNQQMQQQNQQMQLQQPTQLQNALSQNQNNQNLQTQIQVVSHGQQGNMQIHLQQHQVPGQPQQQSVLQSQLTPIMHPSQMQHQQQQMSHIQQQQQQQHSLQHPNHPHGQPGMQQGHPGMQKPLQVMQTHAPGQQGHQMHIQQQMQNQGQVQMSQNHQGGQLSGMQFNQHGQQPMMQQQHHQIQHQLQLQQQQQQQPLQNQGQQVLQPQKSPLPITSQSQSLQNVGGNPPTLHNMQQSMQVGQQQGIQLGVSPIQGLQQQQYQIQNQQQPQMLQQQPGQQQFISPGPSKTPPQQLHPQSPQQHQIIPQMQPQGSMRPPPQPGQQQQQQQSVQFLIQPQNRLQVVMGIPQNQQQYQQQPQQGPPGTPNMQQQQQQQVFRQQQPGVGQGVKPQGQLYHTLQQQRPQGMIQQQSPGGHPVQIMQGGKPVHPPTSMGQTGVNQIQPILSPQQLQNKFQEIGPSSGQQLQQGGQHYNVVIHQGQQYAQMNPPPPKPPTPQRHPGKPMPNQPQIVQRVGVPQPGPPRPGGLHWNNQTQMEIYRHIQMDPNIKAKWAQMDQQQRQLLLQKLHQRHREEQLRKEMMIRQQQLNQQNAALQQSQAQGQQMPQPQQGMLGGPNQQMAGQPQPQTILVQQGIPQAAPSPGADKQSMPIQSIQPPGGSPALVPQPSPSPHSQQGMSPMHPGIAVSQIPGSQVVSTPTNSQQQHQMLMQNQLLSQQNQQKMLNPRAHSPTSKFPPPSPVQAMQTRSPTHPGIPGQTQQPAGTIVRTQQVYTPQVGQHGQPQQRMVLVHQGAAQGQQTTRFPQHQIILQHQQGVPIQGQQVGAPQKVAILQGPHQSPGQPSQPGGQWIPGQQPPQRLGSPTQTTTQFSPRMQSPDSQQRSPGQVWNVRAQPGLITPGSPGPNTAAPYVQVVNSKTKTALANLLNNRLQGNSTGIDTSTPTSTGNAMATLSTSTTLTMCPSSQNLPVPSSQSQQLSLQHSVSSQSMNVVSQRRTLSNLTNSVKTIHQVNSYGAAASRPGTLSQTPSTVALSTARTSFYGFEMNFKPPTNGFLIGCTFWAAQVMDEPNWRYAATFYGGEVLNEYNPSRVTHVLCNNQKFTEFPQVLRDGKRLVTLHWLSDTCSRKIMAPPFYAMHLPTPFNEENLPLKDQTFSLTGFDGDDRERVIKMIVILGALCTPYFTKNSKGLVSCRQDGKKFAKAREWKLPVVSIQFLNELLLSSNQMCLQMIHSPKYQNFTLDQPFRFDINIAPHLMAAWKTPIRVNVDIVEKFKSGKRPLENADEDPERIKRVKLMDDEKQQLAFITDITPTESSENEIKPDLENKRPPVIVFSGFSPSFKSLATEKIVALGGRVTDDIKEATHMVCWRIVTWKLYSALCKLDYIVGAPWLRDSFKVKRFIDESSYITSIVAFEKHHGVTIADVLKKPDRSSLFKGITFYITPGVLGTEKNGLDTIIECGGGVIDRTTRSMAEVRAKARKNPRKYFVIVSMADFVHFNDFFYYKASKQLSVFTNVFLYKTIAEQKVDIGPTPVKKGALLTPKIEPANSA